MSKRNENRSGYKKTKVGWIPAEWECVKIKDVCAQPISGFSVNSTENAVLPITKKIGVLKLSCINAGRFNPYQNKEVIKSDLLKVKTPIYKDTMLISRSNTEELVGAVCYVDDDYPNLFLSDLMWEVSPKKADSINMQWLTNLLLTKNYRKQIAAHANGTSGSMRKITNWKKYKLGEVAKVISKKKLLSVENEILLTVKLHCRGIEKNERIKPKLTKSGRPYYKRFAGEFLIGRQNFHNGGFGIVPKELNGLITSNAISSIAPDNSKLDTVFLFYFFSRSDYYKKIGQIMDGTGQKELSEKQIIKLVINLPPLDLQKHIVSILNTVQQEINLLKKLADTYRTQKNGLMQKLLSGQWRVKHEN